MSAYLVDKSVIDILVTARSLLPRKHPAHDVSKDDLGRMLWRENVKSLVARYHRRHQALTAHVKGGVASYRYENPVHEATEGNRIFDAIQDYEYQACEHKEWEASDAYDYCRDLTMALDPERGVR